ncbi:MAG: integrase [Enterovirga sp.]|nr:integrase [Enterovirga sp.]
MSTLERWLGGSPVAVLLKLLFLSLLVGIVLAAIGLTPFDLVHWVVDGFRELFGFGLDAVRNFGRYILAGAMVVVPLWLLSRLISGRR